MPKETGHACKGDVQAPKARIRARAINKARIRAQSVKARIRARALELGFDVVGFARAEVSEEARADLARWLEEGRHGTMEWMAETGARRSDPRVLWPEAVSVITLGLNYRPHDADPLRLLDSPRRGYISVYARNRDYHDLIKRRLKALARWVVETFGEEVKVFVDTAPVMEKPLAADSGLGWRGKHTNLVSRRFGSWLFLGEVFTTLDLPPDSPAGAHCGRCSACLDVCPTGALDGVGRIDARLCISYLTIEHKEHIDPSLRPLMGNRVYGCDDCTAVCPWNRFAPPVKMPDLMPRAELTAPALADLAALDDAAFRQVFSGSPVKRIGRDRFVRNVLIAVGNSGAAELAPVAARLLDDASPLVRAMAVWSLRRLLPEEKVRSLRKDYYPREKDSDVRAEWLRPQVA